MYWGGGGGKRQTKEPFVDVLRGKETKEPFVDVLRGKETEKGTICGCIEG